MPIDPAILALLSVSVTIGCLSLPIAVFSMGILRYWDPASGSQRQLTLERRTYLVSVLVTFLFLTESIALPLFVHTAGGMRDRFVGAMCATGVFNVNPWGWPALFLAIAVFFAGAVWLMLNRLDNRGYDYPLVRLKYSLLLALTPLVLAGAVARVLFLLQLDQDVITSCCGSMFTPEGAGVAARISGVSPRTALIAFALAGLGILFSGLWCLFSARGEGAHRRTLPCAALGVGSVLAFLVGLVAILSVISPYIYEQPHHHCPFCILDAGYDHIGYWLYIPLFGATALGLGVGAISPWRRIQSLEEAALADTRRFVPLTMILFGLFYGVAGWTMIRSNLIMEGLW